MKKNLLCMIVSMTFFSISMAVTAFAASWQQEGEEWRYLQDDGSYAASQWIEDEGEWYYINDEGYMVRSTIVNGHLISPNGTLVSDTVTHESEADMHEEEIKHIYVLNPDTMYFHLPGCSGAKSASQAQTVTCSRVDVIAQGYMRCRHCRP